MMEKRIITENQAEKGWWWSVAQSVTLIEFDVIEMWISWDSCGSWAQWQVHTHRECFNVDCCRLIHGVFLGGPQLSQRNANIMFPVAILVV